MKSKLFKFIFANRKINRQIIYFYYIILILKLNKQMDIEEDNLED